jgi:hypothetical protein
LNQIEAWARDASTLFHFIDDRMFEMVAHQRLHALKLPVAGIDLPLHAYACEEMGCPLNRAAPKIWWRR